MSKRSHIYADGAPPGRKEYFAVAKSSASADLGETAPPASLSPVIWAVAIASFGAFTFGYHCGVVNGPLNAIAADLGFAGNAALQGTVSICFLNLDLHALHAIKIAAETC